MVKLIIFWIACNAANSELWESFQSFWNSVITHISANTLNGNAFLKMLELYIKLF